MEAWLALACAIFENVDASKENTLNGTKISKRQKKKSTQHKIYNKNFMILDFYNFELILIFSFGFFFVLLFCFC
jgi:polyferredoxin